jgi:hypothetical protein
MTSAKFSLSTDGAPGTEVVAASTLQPAIVAADRQTNGDCESAKRAHHDLLKRDAAVLSGATAHRIADSSRQP